MTERRYTDENDQPMDANLINGQEFIRAITDLTHGDTTISAALELVRSHPEHSHDFPTNTGLVVHIPALSPKSSTPATEEEIDALVEDMLATLKNDLLEEIGRDSAEEPTDG